MNPTPVTAIVIFRNEREHLRGCLESLRWCDELIAINMTSTDGSLAIAREYADRLYHVRPYPIAEPTRVAAAKLASHDWVLLVDPDEHFPPMLAEHIRRAMRERPDAGAFCLPWRFFFKRKMLEGTIWGRPGHKRILIHRDRCRLLPLCNRLNELKPGWHEHKIRHKKDNHIRHYWSDSYRDLLHKHFRRYAHLEAKAMVADGQCWSWRLGFVEPWHELKKCLKDYDGWRLGVRGWMLSAIYFGFVLASRWLTLVYQGRVKPEHERTHGEPPGLVEDVFLQPRRRHRPERPEQPQRRIAA